MNQDLGGMPVCPEQLFIAQQLMDHMRSHVMEMAPEEACGIAAGLGETISVVLPVSNIDHSPVHFRMDPREQLKAMMWIESNALEMLAIYHSHPNGPDGPSQTDLGEFSYPGTPYIIWSGAGRTWTARGFCLDGNRAQEIPIHPIP